ncbi:NnrU family protein [Chelativorans salis]|uniref:NnrU family protein n=1 Tax=Chelativorans salis TaxID=2978478 RepID=A0ABT2LGQ3_9HYPH|nr:NnrU family protein [Chelativorans sp. EGI FJ00035]MCT7373620.1 NnrU family protein [Chelativorans sp. EGI FJ00035]
MLVLILGLLLFLGTHSLLIVAPHLRENVLATRGKGAWMLPYTVASILGLALIVWGYGLARQDPTVLYATPPALRHVTLLLMLPVFPLLIAAYAPGHIKTTIGHPMLIATMLWGAAHLLANGTLADLFLFGGIALWAGADWASVTQRPRGPASSKAPSLRNDVIAVVGGLIVYVVFVGWLHRVLFGVSPL